MRSIQRQLMLRLSVAMLLLAATWGIGLYLYIRGEAVQQFDESLMIRSQTISSLLRQQDDGHYSIDYSDKAAANYAPGRQAEFFQIVWPGHGTMERSKSLGSKDLIDAIEANEHRRAWNLTLPDGRAGRVYSRFATPSPERFDRDEDPHAPRPPLLVPERMIVIVARGREELDVELRRLSWSLWIGCSLLAVVSVLIVGPLVKRGLRPIHFLADDAREMGPATLQNRFAISTLPRELEPIAGAFNDLLDRLQAAFQREKRVNADIAHELRTPITELKTLSEVALRQKNLSERSHDYFSDALAIATRMSRLLQSLSLLGQSQFAAVPITLEPIALGELIDSVLETQQPFIDQRGLQVECLVSSKLIVHSDGQLLRRIIENLIHNAVSHGSSDGPIRIAATQHEQSIVLSISNADDTLETVHLSLMFEPFWQKCAARSDVEHAGLGLTLVQNYARLLAIGLDVQLPKPGRIEFTLRMTPFQPCDQTSAHEKSPQLLSRGL